MCNTAGNLRLAPGEPVTAERVNAIVDRLEAGPAMVGGVGMLISRIGGMFVMSLDVAALPSPMPPVVEAGEFPASDLTYSGNHGEAAIGNTWQQDAAGTGEGVRITMQTGQAYNAGGDRALYAFVRDLTFTPDGRLQAVSAERRVTVANTEAC